MALVVKTGCRESGDMGSIPDECWNPLPRLGHFARHWARQCTDTRAFYIAALSIIFFLGFRQRRSRADRVVNLNTTIQLALFWRTWTRARPGARTRPHVLAWHMGRYYCYCRASEPTDRQVSGFVFSWSSDFLKIQEKWRPRGWEGVFFIFCIYMPNMRNQSISLFKCRQVHILLTISPA